MREKGVQNSCITFDITNHQCCTKFKQHTIFEITVNMTECWKLSPVTFRNLSFIVIHRKCTRSKVLFLILKIPICTVPSSWSQGRIKMLNALALKPTYVTPYLPRLCPLEKNRFVSFVTKLITNNCISLSYFSSLAYRYQV